MCPKLRHLLDLAFSRARTLLTDGKPVFPFLVTSSPGSAVAVREYRTALEDAVKAAKETVAADPGIDCCVLGYHAADPSIGGRPGKTIVAVPFERGSDKTHEYVQDVKPASRGRRAELVKSPRKGREYRTFFPLVPVGESYWRSAGPADIPHLLVAVKSPLSSAWAVERLMALGPDALEPLAQIARDDRCTLLQAYALEIDRLIRGDMNAARDTALADRASQHHLDEGAFFGGTTGRTVR